MNEQNFHADLASNVSLPVKPVRIVHVCTVHPWNDVRIFQKQCISLARMGYDVHLVVPEAPTGVRKGVWLHPLARYTRRSQRMTIGVLRALQIAWRLRGDIYQFHSPELLPIGFLLRFLGKSIVYDVHEDYFTLIRQKSYFPLGVGRLLAGLIRLVERVAAYVMYVTLAERYYARFLPRHNSLLLNYPEARNYLDIPRRDQSGCRVLLFTGNISVDRGSVTQARLVLWDSEVEVHLVGFCPMAVADGARSAAGAAVSRLHIDAVDRFVPHERLRGHYRRDDLLAGLAVFPWTPDTVNKELTKFFEYMAAGLPILCSDFPVWRRLVVDNGVGLAVDPNSPTEVGAALRRLRENPAERQAMSERGRRLVREKFNWATQEKLLAGLYARIVNWHLPGRAHAEKT